jgi:hypothetical protein
VRGYAGPEEDFYLYRIPPMRPSAAGDSS